MSRFYSDGTCRECLQPRELHRLILTTGERGFTYTLYGCIDPSLPDPAVPDDPWEPSAYAPEPRVATLFDPVMV